MKDRHNLKRAIDTAQKAQRNYDLSKSLSNEDLEFLIYSAINSPSKQNETHYSLHVFTEERIIKEIYNETNKFTLSINESLDVNKGEEWLYENLSVKNSQVYANVLFVYVKDSGEARGATHLKGKKGDLFANKVLKEQINFSIGISVGELILTANLLGYRTGICTAMEEDNIKKIIGATNEPKILVGVGFENPQTDRRLHYETLNKDVPKQFRTGNLDEQWKFPSFSKECKVYLDGKNYS